MALKTWNRDGSISLNFAEAEKKARSMTDAELEWSSRDAGAAAMANLEGRKHGFYLDEAHVYRTELARRLKAGWKKEYGGER